MSTLTKEFTAATHIMQSSSTELSTLVSGKAKMLTNESYYLMSYNSRVDVVRLLAERCDTKSNIKLGGFRSQLQASYVFSHTEELWFNETVCLWMTIFIYIYISFGKFMFEPLSIFVCLDLCNCLFMSICFLVFLCSCVWVCARVFLCVCSPIFFRV